MKRNRIIGVVIIVIVAPFLMFIFLCNGGLYIELGSISFLDSEVEPRENQDQVLNIHVMEWL